MAIVELDLDFVKRHQTDEHRSKIGAGAKGRVWSPERRAKIIAALSGVSTGPRSDYCKQKCRETMRRRWGLIVTPEGEMSCAEAAERFDITRQTVSSRIKNSNYPEWYRP